MVVVVVRCAAVERRAILLELEVVVGRSIARDRLHAHRVGLSHQVTDLVGKPDGERVCVDEEVSECPPTDPCVLEVVRPLILIHTRLGQPPVAVQDGERRVLSELGPVMVIQLPGGRHLVPVPGTRPENVHVAVALPSPTPCVR